MRFILVDLSQDKVVPEAYDSLKDLRAKHLDLTDNQVIYENVDGRWVEVESST